MTEKTKRSHLTCYLSVGLVILFVGCLVFAYLWIDRTISLTYLDSSQQTTEQAYDLISALLEQEWRGLSEGETLRRLQAEAARHPHGDILIKHDASENVIWFDNIRFEFHSGRLIKIH